MSSTPAPRVDIVERLTAAGCVAAAEEAAELLRAAPDDATLDMWLERREQGEPLAWIVGTTEFGGRRIHVAPNVYVPRTQSEELARRAAGMLPVGGVAVDLCTGAGAIAAHLQATVPRTTVIGVDIDAGAAACARRNGVPTVVGDLTAPLRADLGVDVVTAVAPYVPTADLRLLPADVQRHEPRAALDGGADGLELVRRVIAGAARLLRPTGWLMVEVGGDQDPPVADALAQHGFARLARWYDDDHDLRGIAAQFRGEAATQRHARRLR